MEKYVRKVNYYETDKMGITHNSNYIRWMEEARIDYLDQAGMGYRKLEEDGVISAVVGIECEYKKATTFGDTVEITVEVDEDTGAKLILSYIMRDAKDRMIVLRRRSTHCFPNNYGRPVILRNSFPEFDAKLKEMAEGEKHEQ